MHANVGDELTPPFRHARRFPSTLIVVRQRPTHTRSQRNRERVLAIEQLAQLLSHRGVVAGEVLQLVHRLGQARLALSGVGSGVVAGRGAAGLVPEWVLDRWLKR
jgi:hypothetical protein